MIKVSVCMITYNHEKYITKAIESILMQKTDFNFELIISNDNSTDSTHKNILEILNKHPESKRIKYIHNKENLGMMPNFIQVIHNCKGEYIALCEGDDYWTNPEKLQKQVDFLDANKNFSMCFHPVNIDFHGKITEDNITKQVKKHTSIYDLAAGNYIHTCSVLYRNNLYDNFPKYFYSAPVGDYFLHLLNAQYGDIYRLEETMGNYRVHDTSYWSSKKQNEREKIWIEFLENIKPLFSKKIQKVIDIQIKSNQPKKIGWFKKKRKAFKNIFFQKIRLSNLRKKYDLIIADDILPSTLSPWRNLEYNELIKIFDNSIIYTDTSTYVSYSQDKTFNENLNSLEKLYPFVKNKIKKLKRTSNMNCNLFYTIFYNNINKHFDFLEANKIPFAFTLYPGGGFVMNNDETDKRLKEIFSSKFFKGVIVNQYITKEYLLKKRLVDPEKIKLIFGVPISIEKTPEKIEKSTNKMNILFFANKYTKNGEDKGFDVFQLIAKELISKSTSYNFTIIGSFDYNDLKISDLQDYFNFKGILDEKLFNEELKKTHIIISPNMPFKIAKGSFDGFPLATCISASIYENVLILTDYFNEAEKINLIDGIDFIKFDSDINKVVNEIEALKIDPQKMNTIAINGKNKLLNLYNYNNQITPRINFIKNILN
ncbi:glycosyltransferase [Flavobacterium sp.]|uniref:glycosyltransferase n=1 Tax=Flavobacterium sp. TaxID=239 RepID=UPI003D0E8437